MGMEVCVCMCAQWKMKKNGSSGKMRDEGVVTAI